MEALPEELGAKASHEGVFRVATLQFDGRDSDVCLHVGAAFVAIEIAGEGGSQAGGHGFPGPG